ncbi:hypothetical protein BKA62DRAFT_161896 [Auriculariales sp. MPI-PUGE-AT-0066]|nr:hypothetical protein BKA62DRAFT_161896 [Auriculariales sp. MPI-PUGE-AT-0066]
MRRAGRRPADAPCPSDITSRPHLHVNFERQNCYSGMDDPNNPLALPLPPSSASSLRPPPALITFLSSGLGGRLREREPSPHGRTPQSPGEHGPPDGAQLLPTVSGIGDGSTPPQPDTTIHALLLMMRDYLAARKADMPSVAVAQDATNDAKEQQRKAREAARFKRQCPWEETVEILSWTKSTLLLAKERK